MFVTRHDLAVTTAADGTATVYSAVPVNGRVLQIRYVPHGSTPLDTGADIILTAETTGVIVLDQDNIGTSAFTSVPYQPTHLPTTGAANANTWTYVVLANERLKLTVAQGADTKSGTFYVYVG